MFKSLKFILYTIIIVSLYNCDGGPSKEQKEVIDAQAHGKRDPKGIYGRQFRFDNSYFIKEV